MYPNFPMYPSYIGMERLVYFLHTHELLPVIKFGPNQFILVSFNPLTQILKHCLNIYTIKRNYLGQVHCQLLLCLQFILCYT
jgi:hypothetical protein